MSVVVSALNAEAELPSSLRSILAGDYPATRLEVVVVDNGSGDRTSSIAREAGVRCLCEARRGVGFARNHGIRSTGGDIVAFLDPDSLATSTWLTELVTAFADERVGVAGGPVLPYPGTTLAERYAARRRSHDQARALSHPRAPFLLAANLAARREALRATMFDTALPGGGWEDADLCWRLTERGGLKLGFAPRAVVFHRYRRTPGEFLTQHYRYGYGLALLRRKHPDSLNWHRRERARAYRALGASVLGLLRAGVAHALGRGGREEVGYGCLEVLRQIGQRTGFAAGSLPRAGPLAPFRTPASSRGGR